MKTLTSSLIYSIFSLIFLILSILLIISTLLIPLFLNFYNAYSVHKVLEFLFFVGIGILAFFTIINFVLAIIIMAYKWNDKEIHDSSILWGLLTIFLLGPIGLIIFFSRTIKKRRFQNKENNQYQNVNLSNSKKDMKQNSNKMIESLKKEVIEATNKNNFELASKLKNMISDLEMNN